MKQPSLLWFTLYCFTSCSVWAKSIEMDKTVFDSLTASGIWFVEHFSPYCHFCVDFAPTWIELTEEEEGLASTHDIHFGTIDCSIHGDLCIEHDITGYPKMKLYVNGKYAHTYLGARSKDSIKYYLLQAHRKLTKIMSARHKETKPKATLVTSSGDDSLTASTRFAQNNSRQKNPPETPIIQFNATADQDLRDDQPMMILGTYGREDEQFRKQFQTLSEQANGAAIFVEMDLETNSDLAPNFYDIQTNKILIVDRKNKHYYDRDIHAKLLDIQQPQHILQALDDAIAGKLKGLPIGQLEKHGQHGYGMLGWYDYLMLAVFALLMALVYKIISRKKSLSRNSAHIYVNTFSKLV